MPPSQATQRRLSNLYASSSQEVTVAGSFANNSEIYAGARVESDHQEFVQQVHFAEQAQTQYKSLPSAWVAEHKPGDLLD